MSNKNTIVIEGSGISIVLPFFLFLFLIYKAYLGSSGWKKKLLLNLIVLKLESSLSTERFWREWFNFNVLLCQNLGNMSDKSIFLSFN